MTTPVSLRKLLMVGTSRAPLPADLLEPELAAFASTAFDGPDITPERRLWLATGAADLWSRAGYVPPPAPARQRQPSAQEELPACPVRAESVLKHLLEGGHAASLQTEWLDRLARKPARLPERFLPNMLELATREPGLRARMHTVLGMRGKWLAALKPAWAWATQAPDADEMQRAWHDGALEQRVAALEAWRSMEPDAARAALEASWPAEPPENRTAFVPCLGIGLAAADEAFLEAALDDRRKPVRVAAQRLLARLPGSKLSQRMLARVAPLLQLERDALHGTRLVVALPAECDAAMVRDGVGEGRRTDLGEKAGWLMDMLSTIDPSLWSASHGLSPDECRALGAATEYEHALLLGWTNALQLHLSHGPTPGLLAWLGAWTRMWLQADDAVSYRNPRAFFGAYAALSAPVMHAIVLDVVGASRVTWQGSDAPLVELLHELATASREPWPAELSRAIAPRLLGGLDTLKERQAIFHSALPALAAVLDPAATLEAMPREPGLANDTYGLQDAVDRFFQLVRFRHEMILSFQEPA